MTEKNVKSFEVKSIGRVASPLTDLETAARQADEGAPETWLIFEPEMLDGTPIIDVKPILSRDINER